MLNTWLASLTLASFKREFLRRQPFAQPNSAGAATTILTWDLIDRLLQRKSADVLVVARGKLVDLPRPQNLVELRMLMQHGVGIVVRRAERQDTALAEVALSFAEDLGGEAHIQVFVTPGGTHGFGWHYDKEDVFIAQTYGRKDYLFRQNTVVKDVLHDRVDFEPFGRENSPVGAATLIPGDWLYVPSGWWHMAKCVQDSLSISVGVLLGDDNQHSA